MEKLLSFLNQIPEYNLLRKGTAVGATSAVTGVGQINRSHLIAALHRDLSRPMVVIVQDDMAAKRLQEELKAFTGQTAPVLPAGN